MSELSTLKVVKNLTPYNFTDKNDIGRIKYIVIHYFGSLGTAKAVSNYFASAYRGASAHYSLDEESVVYQSVEDDDIAWHCGTSKTYYHDECRNSNSIGIEVRPHKLNVASLYGSESDWYFSDKTVDNLVEFTRYLMAKYDIDVDHVLRHYDITHKQCPRPFEGDDKNLYYGVTGNQKWEEFKKRLVSEEEEEMTLERFEELYNEMMSKKKGDNPSEWAKASCEKAKAAGVFGGDGAGNYNWQDSISREAVAVVMDRAGLLKK